MKDRFKLRLKLRLSAGCIISFLSLIPWVSANSLEEQRTTFQAARLALQENQVEAARLFMAELRGYPLAAWLEAQLLTADFEQSSDTALVSFMSNHPHSVMSDSLAARLAARLAGRGQWAALLTLIPENPEQLTTQCYRAEALIHTGSVKQGLEQAQALWQTTKKDLPNDCSSLLWQLKNHKQLASSDYWRRIQDLMGNKRVNAARQLAVYLTEEDQQFFDLWLTVRSAPTKKLPELFSQPDSAQVRAIIVDTIKQIADDKLQTALPLWAQAQTSFKFTKAEQGEVESRLGMWEAWRHDEAGLQRLKQITVTDRSPEGNAWLARLAMRSQDWPALLEAASALDTVEGSDDEWDTWRYWQARALEQLKKTKEAHALYAGLAKNSTYYGFLAADRIQQDYARLTDPPPDRTQRIQGLQKLAVYQRWQEWNALGERGQARKEWFRLLQAMDKEGVLAAAELALREGDANLAIWTVSRVKDWNSVDLRFPLLYEQIVMDQARSQGIRPEWILGIMRRESAFDAKAESSAKALGLMQLMPGTARDISRQMGMQVLAKEDILQPDLNVKLGSTYLRDMLKRFSGNYAQATAAYNAGPGRIPKWAPPQNLAADQWVESIPFEETRKYVRAVMAYTTVYDHKLNQDQHLRLSMRLQPIPAK
ncbi:soluble lytic murein transglycosylase [Thiothrix eikelboomii]|uniref:Soluble lytic murein transglycosylase n=1 Tax=Thiothrix eikelboomii TaxID=92487 RepID=A0A1T4VVK0_9GAMM|nr:lytic transglycosylase domain-containing protein [Thiothrix eikelboomii]SKA68845.1 soluble lytic murein transglycosylase [Thiothrix eikelboomii]